MNSRFLYETIQKVVLILISISFFRSICRPDSGNTHIFSYASAQLSLTREVYSQLELGKESPTADDYSSVDVEEAFEVSFALSVWAVTLTNSMSHVIFRGGNLVNVQIAIYGALLAEMLESNFETPLTSISIDDVVWTDTATSDHALTILGYFPKDMSITISNCIFTVANAAYGLRLVNLSELWLSESSILEIASNTVTFLNTEPSTDSLIHAFYLRLNVQSNSACTFTNNSLSISFSSGLPYECQLPLMEFAINIYGFTLEHLSMGGTNSTANFLHNTIRIASANAMWQLNAYFIAFAFGNQTTSALAIGPGNMMAIINSTINIESNSSNQVTFILMRIDVDTVVDGGQLSIENSTVIVNTTSATTVKVLGASYTPLSILNRGILRIQRTVMSTSYLATPCARADISQTSLTLLFQWLQSPIRLEGRSAIIVDENTVVHPPPAQGATTSNSYLYLLQTDYSNLTQTSESYISIQGNSVTSWMSQCGLHTGGSPMASFWVSNGSSVVINDNSLVQVSHDGSLSTQNALFTASAASFRMLFSQTKISMQRNTVEFAGSYSGSVNLFGWFVFGVGSLYMVAGCQVSLIGNQFYINGASNTSTASALVYLQSEYVLLSRNTYSAGVIAQILSPNIDVSVIYRHLTTVPTATVSARSSFECAYNVLRSHYTRGFINGAFAATVSDGITMFGIVNSASFVVYGSVLAILGNTVIASGVSGGTNSQSPSIMTTVSSVVRLDGGWIAVQENCLVTGGSPEYGQPILVTPFATRIVTFSAAPLFLNSSATFIISGNSVSMAQVQIYSSTAWHFMVLIHSVNLVGNSRLEVSSNVETVQALVRVGSTDYDPTNVSEYRPANMVRVIILGLTNIASLRSYIDLHNNSFVLKVGILSDVRLAHSVNSPGVNADAASIMYVCDNSVNGYTRPFANKRIVLREFLAAGPAFTYKQCADMINSRTSTSSITPPSLMHLTQSATPSHSRSITRTTMCSNSAVCEILSFNNASLCLKPSGPEAPLVVPTSSYLYPNTTEVPSIIADNYPRHNMSTESHTRIGTFNLMYNSRRLVSLQYYPSAASPLIILGSRRFAGTGLAIDVVAPSHTITYGSTVAQELPVYYHLLIGFSAACETGQGRVSFNRTFALEAPLWFEPKPASTSETIAAGTSTATGVVSVVGGGIVVPAAAMQQGVALALMRMAECEKDSLDGEPLDVLVHPLRFGIGGGVARFARGAVVSNLILLPLLWAALAFLPIPWAVASLLDRPLATARDSCGWPSSLLVPFAVLGEGSAMASVALLSRDSPGDAVLGAFGIILLLSSLVGWVWFMLVRLPPAQMKLVFMPRIGVLQRITDTRWEWAIAGKGDTEGTDDMDSPVLLRHNHCYGEFWWMWSAVCGYAFSLLVGVAEGMPNDTDALCRLRWVVACVGAVLQSLAVLSCTIPFQLVLLGATGALICVLVSLVAISTFSGGSSGSNSDAINTVGTLNALIGIALMVFGVGRLGYEFLRGRAQQRRRALTEEISDGQVVPTPHLEPVVPTTNLNDLGVELLKQEHSSFGGNIPSAYLEMPPAWRSILMEADEITSPTSGIDRTTK